MQSRLTKHIAFVTGSDNDIAMLEHLKDRESLSVFLFLTASSHPATIDRQHAINTWMTQRGIPTHQTVSVATMGDLAMERRVFPKSGNLFCVSLKTNALTAAIRDSELDPMDCTIYLATNRFDGAGERYIWPSSVPGDDGYDREYPIINLSRDEIDRLVIQAGFTTTGHASLECVPCPYHGRPELMRYTPDQIETTDSLQWDITNGRKLRRLFPPHDGVSAVLGDKSPSTRLCGCDGGFCMAGKVLIHD